MLKGLKIFCIGILFLLTSICGFAELTEFEDISISQGREFGFYPDNPEDRVELISQLKDNGVNISREDVSSVDVKFRDFTYTNNTYTISSDDDNNVKTKPFDIYLRELNLSNGDDYSLTFQAKNFLLDYDYKEGVNLPNVEVEFLNSSGGIEYEDTFNLQIRELSGDEIKEYGTSGYGFDYDLEDLDFTGYDVFDFYTYDYVYNYDSLNIEYRDENGNFITEKSIGNEGTEFDFINESGVIVDVINDDDKGQEIKVYSNNEEVSGELSFNFRDSERVVKTQDFTFNEREEEDVDESLILLNGTSSYDFSLDDNSIIGSYDIAGDEIHSGDDYFYTSTFENDNRLNITKYDKESLDKLHSYKYNNVNFTNYLYGEDDNYGDNNGLNNYDFNVIKEYRDGVDAMLLKNKDGGGYREGQNVNISLVNSSNGDIIEEKNVFDDFNTIIQDSFDEEFPDNYKVTDIEVIGDKIYVTSFVEGAYTGTSDFGASSIFVYNSSLEVEHYEKNEDYESDYSPYYARVEKMDFKGEDYLLSAGGDYYKSEETYFKLFKVNPTNISLRDDITLNNKVNEELILDSIGSQAISALTPDDEVLRLDIVEDENISIAFEYTDYNFPAIISSKYDILTGNDNAYEISGNHTKYSSIDTISKENGSQNRILNNSNFNDIEILTTQTESERLESGEFGKVKDIKDNTLTGVDEVNYNLSEYFQNYSTIRLQVDEGFTGEEEIITVNRDDTFDSANYYEGDKINYSFTKKNGDVFLNIFSYDWDTQNLFNLVVGNSSDNVGTSFQLDTEIEKMERLDRIKTVEVIGDEEYNLNLSEFVTGYSEVDVIINSENLDNKIISNDDDYNNSLTGRDINLELSENGEILKVMSNNLDSRYDIDIEFTKNRGNYSDLIEDDFSIFSYQEREPKEYDKIPDYNLGESVPIEDKLTNYYELYDYFKLNFTNSNHYIELNESDIKSKSFTIEDDEGRDIFRFDIKNTNKYTETTREVDFEITPLISENNATSYVEDDILYEVGNEYGSITNSFSINVDEDQETDKVKDRNKTIGDVEDDEDNMVSGFLRSIFGDLSDNDKEFISLFLILGIFIIVAVLSPNTLLFGILSSILSLATVFILGIVGWIPMWIPVLILVVVGLLSAVFISKFMITS